MKVGDTIKCNRANGTGQLTEGREYDVLVYCPESTDESGFKWPAYVTVRGDFHQRITCYASRFEVVS